MATTGSTSPEDRNGSDMSFATNTGGQWSLPDRGDLGVSDPQGSETDTLDEATCLRLLAGKPIGRLGFSSLALPVVIPVNYVLRERTIVFGSEEGEKARAARERAVACLQVDQFDEQGLDGWSVLATGRLGVVPPSRRPVDGPMPRFPWTSDSPALLVELFVELVSGRRIRHLEADSG